MPKTGRNRRAGNRTPRPERQALASALAVIRLTLNAAQVDATIEGARAGTFAIRAVREYIRGRVPRDLR